MFATGTYRAQVGISPMGGCLLGRGELKGDKGGLDEVSEAQRLEQHSPGCGAASIALQVGFEGKEPQVLREQLDQVHLAKQESFVRSGVMKQGRTAAQTGPMQSRRCRRVAVAFSFLMTSRAWHCLEAFTTGCCTQHLHNTTQTLHVRYVARIQWLQPCKTWLKGLHHCLAACKAVNDV